MADAAPDNVFIDDIIVPAVDGFEFLERLRDREQLTDIPVVVLTAKTLTDDDQKRLVEEALSELDFAALSGDRNQN